MKNRLKIFEEKDKFFKEISFFNADSGEFIQDFKLKILHKNQDLYRQKEPTEFIYIIKSGSFKVYNELNKKFICFLDKTRMRFKDIRPIHQ